MPSAIDAPISRPVQRRFLDTKHPVLRYGLEYACAARLATVVALAAPARATERIRHGSTGPERALPVHIDIFVVSSGFRVWAVRSGLRGREIGDTPRPPESVIQFPITLPIGRKVRTDEGEMSWLSRIHLVTALTDVL
jgi:hypothetical protein